MYVYTCLYSSLLFFKFSYSLISLPAGVFLNDNFIKDGKSLLRPSLCPLLPIHCRCRGLKSHSVTHTNTHTRGRTSLEERSAQRIDLYLTTHNNHKRQATTTLAGFEPTVPARERPQTHTLDRASTGIGAKLHL